MSSFALFSLCRRLWPALLLLAALQGPAQAAPVVGGSLSGQAGGTVTVSFTDDLTAFEASDLTVSFDSSVLSYAGNSFPLGSAVPNPSQAGLLVFSLVADPAPFTGTGQLVLELSFNIASNASPGSTTVSFSFLDDPGLYAPAAFTALVTVRPSTTALPLAGSHWLAATALLLLPVARRRRASAA